MAEYIERDAYMRYLSSRKAEFVEDYGKGWSAGIDTAIRACEKFPSADVAPVRHGRWEHNSDFPDRFICYGCGAMFDMWKHEQRLFNYCPNCGAKMEGERKENENV